MLITKSLAFQMERCIKNTHIEITKEYSQGKILDINGGAACFSGFNSYFSQVIGWGFLTQPKCFKDELRIIENFYKSLNHPRIDIELCPYAGSELVNFLNERGYGLTEVNNVSFLDLKSFERPTMDTSCLIKEVPVAEFDEWVARVASGFGYSQAKDQFLRYIKAKGVRVFAAYDEGKIIAGATLAIHEGFCDFGLASTLPAFRGRGLQKKLLMARLNFAREQGLSMAMVTTEPGTISDKNIQTSGFRCAYTRIKMTKKMTKK